MERDSRPGAVRGVFIPAFITISGVILFIRFPWIAAQAGLFGTLGIVFLAWFIAFVTSLSMSAVFSEGRPGLGGIYYMISRSLGLAMGGTLALAMFVALSFSASLFLLGFSETFLSYSGWDTTPWNIRIVGLCALIVVAVLSMMGAKFRFRLRLWVFLLLLFSLGLVLFSPRTGLIPDYANLRGSSEAQPWIRLFAIFFPAVTGFEAGFSLASQLRRPVQNIRKGILTAVIAGLLLYLLFTWYFTFRLDADVLIDHKLILPRLVELPGFMYFAIFGVALVAAFSSMFAAPRILQASAVDKITPRFFAKGLGKTLIPRNAMLVSFLIALAGIMTGDFESVAAIATVLFLVTYGFINLAMAFGALFNQDFKPDFKVPALLNILIAIICIVLISQIHLISLASISFILFLLYLLLKKREYSLQSGNSWMGFLAFIVKAGLHGLSKRIDKSLTWRPNIILFSGPAKRRPHLIELAKLLVGKPGIFTNFELIENPQGDTPLTKTEQTAPETDMSGKFIFSRKHVCSDLFDGIDNVARFYGFSGFEPNTVLMGWPHHHKNPERFSKSLKNLKSLDLNTVLLSYRKLTGFGSHSHIDFWWNGQGRNLSFALTLLKYISSAPDWRLVQIRILVISYETRNTEKIYRSIRQALLKHKVNARIKVIHNGLERLPEWQIIKAESSHTDLSILEIPDKSYKNLLPAFKTIDQTLELIDTALVINASSTFEELNAEALTEQAPLFPELPPESQHAAFIKGIPLPAKETLSNEVFTAAGNFEIITSNFISGSFQKIAEAQKEYLSELKDFSLRVLYALEKNINLPEDEFRFKAFQKSISDVSFTSQKQLDGFKAKLVNSQHQWLKDSAATYLEELDNYLLLIPEKVHVDFLKSELTFSPSDSFRLRWYKLYYRILHSSALHIHATVPLRASAEYYIYHQHLASVQDAFRLFGVFTFRQVSELRKIYTIFYETIEKIRILPDDTTRAREIFRLERDRLLAKIEVLQNENDDFLKGIENRLFESLTENFKNWSLALDKPDKNFEIIRLLSRQRGSFVKEEALLKIPSVWKKNITLYISRCHLDFLLLGLRNRISAKIRKKTEEFRSIIDSQVLSELKMVKEQVQQKLLPGKAVKEGFINIKFKSRPEFMPLEFFGQFYKEIEAVVKELPEKILIIEESFLQQIDQGRFSESEDIEVPMRKTAQYYMSMELINPAQKLLHEIADELNQSAQIIKDVVRLTNFNLENTSGDLAEVFDEASNALKKKDLLESLLQRIEEEEARVVNRVEEARTKLDRYLGNAFEPLNILSITRNSESVNRKIRAAQERHFWNSLEQKVEKINRWTQQKMVSLIYSQSETALLAGKIDLEPVTHYSTNENFLQLLDQLAPNKDAIKEIPFYYQSLFSNRSSISADFWVGMRSELETCTRVLHRFRNGYAGGLLILGERNSGKSSLSKYLTRKNFAPENIHSILAPKAGSVKVDDFHAALHKAFGSANSIDDLFRTMPPSQVLIIHDLELWWERSPQGLEVIYELRRLIDLYASRCFIIVNANTQAYSFIERIIPLSGLFLGTVVCKPFDARELKQMVMLRHKAGGLSFVLDKQAERKLSEWDYARLFNRYFDICEGKPGVAINLWLSSIQGIKEKTLFMETPKRPDLGSLGTIDTETALLIVQFLLHRRFTVEKLARIMHCHVQQSDAAIHALLRAGILEEKFKDVFALNPYLEPFLLRHLKEMELI